MAVKRENNRTGWHEIWGLALFCVAVLLLLAIYSFDPGDISALSQPGNKPPLNLIGPVGAWTAYILFFLLGAPGFLIPFALLGAAGLLLFLREGRLSPRMLSLGGLMVSLSWLAALTPSLWTGLMSRINLDLPGGVIGNVLGRILIANALGNAGSGILGFGLLLISMVFLFRISPRWVGNALASAARWATDQISLWRQKRMESAELIEEKQRQLARQQRRLEQELKRERRENPIIPESQPVPVPLPTVLPPIPQPIPPPVVTPEPEAKPVRTAPLRPPVRRPDPAPTPEPPPLALPVSNSTFQLPPFTVL
ncbi:MAG: DNA translocase FtsK 4TM domain-containing protein, partial [Kiritimatiellia bacterium]|nr:DNA translocase FtsK 4TM domain-containing protein [Kiritimatiellia bacterium]